MAKRSSTKKQETHERIVRTAAAAIRRKGYAGVGVAEVMDEAGLTHGGFYAHFADRDAMLVEALDAAAGQALEAISKGTAAAPPGKALDTLVDHYLSDRHVAEVETGCTIAALGPETARQPPEFRRVMTRRVKEFADLIARQSPSWGSAHSRGHEEALATMAAMLGAVILARAVDDPALGKAVRTAAKRLVTKRS